MDLANLQPLKKLIIVYAIIFTCNNTYSKGVYRYGGSLGFGYSGLQQAASVDGSSQVVERAEGPAAVGLFVETLYSDFWSLSLEHNRGINMAPFSMGSSFTGIAARYYYMGPIPAVGNVNPESTYLFVKRLAPFIGPAFGVAMADIRRENDKVANISGSGIYYGFRAGADYPLAPGRGLRPEFIYSTTFMQSPTLPSKVNEFALRLGLYYFY